LDHTPGIGIFTTRIAIFFWGVTGTLRFREVKPLIQINGLQI